MSKRRPRRRGHLRQRGSSWVVVFRIDGKSVWRSFKQREQAELYLADVQVKLARKEMRAPLRVTFGEAAEAWHKHGQFMKGWKPSTARDYRSVLDKWLLPSFGSKQLDAVTVASLTSWHRSRMEAGEMPRRT